MDKLATRQKWPWNPWAAALFAAVGTYALMSFCARIAYVISELVAQDGGGLTDVWAATMPWMIGGLAVGAILSGLLAFLLGLDWWFLPVFIAIFFATYLNPIDHFQLARYAAPALAAASAARVRWVPRGAAVFAVAGLFVGIHFASWASMQSEPELAVQHDVGYEIETPVYQPPPVLVPDRDGLTFSLVEWIGVGPGVRLRYTVTDQQGQLSEIDIAPGMNCADSYLPTDESDLFIGTLNNTSSTVICRQVGESSVVIWPHWPETTTEKQAMDAGVQLARDLREISAADGKQLFGRGPVS